jgi:hypothetical protein
VRVAKGKGLSPVIGVAAGLAAGALALWAGRKAYRLACEPAEAADPRQPCWPKLLCEYLATGRMLAGQLRPPIERAIGGGQPVLLIPGLLLSDLSTWFVRRSLRQCGFAPYGWDQGLNLGARADLLDRLCARLDQIIAESGGPVALLGWSLGGLYARELAKLRPADISLVVTLGSPFSFDLRANNAWRLYELINDHPVDRPPIEVNLPEKPPVRTVAIWSDLDGIVAPAAAAGLPGEADEQRVIHCRHNEMVTHGEAFETLLDELERWVATRPADVDLSGSRQNVATFG